MNTHIEPMLNKHLDTVVDIESKVQPFPWTKGNFIDCLNAGYKSYVAICNNQVVGFYVLLLAPDVAHLLLVSVAPEHQKQGIGKQLLKHCHDIALSNKYDRVILETRASNQRALSFYKQLGYLRIAIKAGYYPTEDAVREDAHILEKSLHAHA